MSLTTAVAQQIPNGNFENWGSSYSPDGWGTWAGATSIASMAKLATIDTGIGQQTNGRASLRLSVDTVTVPFQGQITLSGFAVLGGARYIAPPSGTGIQYGSLPYIQLPDTLFFDYKYLAATGSYDTALMTMLLTRYDTASHSRKTFLGFTLGIDTASQWTTRVLPLQKLYDSTITGLPDTLQIIFYASLGAAHRGATLWVDSLRFDASVIVVSSIEDIKDANVIYAYPNPTQQAIHVVAKPEVMGSRIALLDMQGREVYSGKIDKNPFTISTTDLPSGCYSLQVTSVNPSTTSHGKINIVH